MGPKKPWTSETRLAECERRAAEDLIRREFWNEDANAVRLANIAHVLAQPRDPELMRRLIDGAIEIKPGAKLWP